MTSILAALTLAAAAQANYNHGTLSDDEQQILEVINRARRNPTLEGIRLGIAIDEGLVSAPTTVIPRPPLAPNAKLIAAAEAHLTHLYANNYFDYNFPAGTVPPASTLTPEIRIANAGYTLTDPAWTTENIATGPASTPAALQDLLMRDAGTTERVNRRRLLNIYADTAGLPFREIGIAYEDKLVDKSVIKRHILVQDFASTAEPVQNAIGPFLVGVIYTDANSSLFYDVAEGIGGVEIRIAGHLWKATSSASGGYAMPITGAPAASGIVDVQASGGSLGITGVIKKFRVTGQNVKLDFLPGDLVDTDTDGLPDYWETFYFTSAVPTSDIDGDGFTALQEYQFSSDPGNAASTPDNPLAAPAPPSTDDEEMPEGCGTLGVEVLLLLALRGLLRRR